MANFTNLGQDITSYFTPSNKPYFTQVSNSTTGFKISLKDISSNYLGIRSSSKIPVSTIFTTNFSRGGNDISNLYELYLTNYVGTKDTDYKIWDPVNHDGLLIQITKNTSISFRYRVSLEFVMIGGGGGGGPTFDGIIPGIFEAGGGGGAGELITGRMTNIPANITIQFTIGSGGISNSPGNNSTMVCNGITITANGGGAGAQGGKSSSGITGSSTGGSGSTTTSTLVSGVATDKTIVNNGYFNTMVSYNNRGGSGQDQNNSSGAGGGGGGSVGVGGNGGTGLATNAYGGSGGIGSTITFGTTNFEIGGGGGGGARDNGYNGGGRIGGAASYGGGNGGGIDTSVPQAGISGNPNTGGGGGGGGNSGTGPNNGGTGGSGTIILYITPSNVSETMYDATGTYTETFDSGFYNITFTTPGTIRFNRNIPILSVIVLGAGGSGGGTGTTYNGTPYYGWGGGAGGCGTIDLSNSAFTNYTIIKNYQNTQFQIDASNCITSTSGGSGGVSLSGMIAISGTSSKVGFAGYTFRQIDGGDGGGVDGVGNNSIGMTIQGRQYRYGGGGGNGGPTFGGLAGLNGIGGAYNSNSSTNGQTANTNSYSSGGGGAGGGMSASVGDGGQGAVIFIFAA